MAHTSGLAGVAGEHFVAAELARRGYLVTLTRGNAPGIDILAYWPATKKTVACQVKASDGRKKQDGQWILTPKDEDVLALRSDFFIFVYMPTDFGAPQYSIVPSKTVAAQVRAEFEAWLATPGKNGKQRSATNGIRHFFDKQGKWRGRWNLIEELVTTTIEVAAV